MNLRARLARLKRLQPRPWGLVGADGQRLIRIIPFGAPIPTGARQMTEAEGRILGRTVPRRSPHP